MKTRARFSLLAGILMLLVAPIGFALVETQDAGLARLTFRAPQLQLDKEPAAFAPALSLGEQQSVDEDLRALGLARKAGRLDKRGGRWTALRLRRALTPGRNELRWSQFGRAKPRNRREWAGETSKAFRQFVRSQRRALRLNPAELAEDERVTVYDDGDLVNIHIPRRFQGIPVRGSYLTAKVARGNLTLMGTQRWGDIKVSTRAKISAQAAMNIVQAYAEPSVISREWGKSELVIVPTKRRAGRKQARLGKGYRYRLAWAVRPEFEGARGSYEGLVDAHTGELLAFEDQNQYTAEATGGVYPVTNDGLDPDGVEQPGWPMPFMNVGSAVTTTGGNYDLEGSQTATFTGPYVRINDNCGSASLTDVDGIDWGASGGTDCQTPGFGGAGNTHASRTGFYELNKIMEMARGQLPQNNWLQQQLVANMNINVTQASSPTISSQPKTKEGTESYWVFASEPTLTKTCSRSTRAAAWANAEPA